MHNCLFADLLIRMSESTGLMRPGLILLSGAPITSGAFGLGAKAKLLDCFTVFQHENKCMHPIGRPCHRRQESEFWAASTRRRGRLRKDTYPLVAPLPEGCARQLDSTIRKKLEMLIIQHVVRTRSMPARDCAAVNPRLQSPGHAGARSLTLLLDPLTHHMSLHVRVQLLFRPSKEQVCP